MKQHPEGKREYRVLREDNPELLDAIGVGESIFTIVDCYLAEDGETIWAYTPAANPLGDSMSELRTDIFAMARATLRPILTPADLPERIT